jgi:hypothetical protein
VEKTSGATVGINIVDSCDSTECIASDTNRVVWPNVSDEEVTWLVAIETDFAISQAAMEGPYPETVDGDLGDFESDSMPTNCGSASGRDVWFNIPVPPATQMDFTGTLGSSFSLGYSLDCDTCEEFQNWLWTSGSFTYTNTSAATA